MWFPRSTVGFTVVTVFALASAACGSPESDFGLPPELVASYQRFVHAATQGTAEDVQKHLLPGILIEADPRDASTPSYGAEINLPFMHSQFSPRLVLVRQYTEDAWLLRTPTSLLVFVNTAHGGWLVASYRDKPME